MGRNWLDTIKVILTDRVLSDEDLRKCREGTNEDNYSIIHDLIELKFYSIINSVGYVVTTTRADSNGSPRYECVRQYNFDGRLESRDVHEKVLIGSGLKIGKRTVSRFYNPAGSFFPFFGEERHNTYKEIN